MTERVDGTSQADDTGTSETGPEGKAAQEAKPELTRKEHVMNSVRANANAVSSALQEQSPFKEQSLNRILKDAKVGAREVLDLTDEDLEKCGVEIDDDEPVRY